LQIPLMVIL